MYSTAQVAVLSYIKISIATSVVHSKLDYCNSLCYNLRNCQKVDWNTPQNQRERPIKPNKWNVDHVM